MVEIVFCNHKGPKFFQQEVSKMKKLMTILGVVVLAGVIAYPVFAHGPGWGRGGHMMGYYDGGSGHCWEYGGGYARGPRMMNPRYGSEPRFQGSDKPLEESKVKSMLNDYLRSTGNPNLKLGEINERESVFEAEILTKDGSLVDKLAVDKSTGWMRSVY
jgi:hypothetical protein